MIATVDEQIRAGEHIKYALGLLTEPGQVVELRVPKVGGRKRTDSGYFDNPEALTAAAQRYNGRDTVYITLNPVYPDLLARAANRVREYADTTTGDAHIARRLWFYLDVDPVRPAEISSSDEEHSAALARVGEMAAWLAGMGWPEPVRSDSGNGGHALWRVDLPNDDMAKDLLGACLNALDLIWSDDALKVDETTFNASRLLKLYGTKACKGDNIPSRPHRYSHILTAPESLQVVTVDQLRQLAAMAPQEEPQAANYQNGNGQSFDLEGWLSEHGLTGHKKSWKGGALWQLDQCPFSTAHTSGAFVGQQPSGALFAGCQHSSCKGKGWAELRALYEEPEPTIIYPTNGTSPATNGTGPSAGKNGTEPKAKEEKPNQATLIYQRAAVALTVFRSKSGEAFAEIHIDGHKETHPLRSQAIRNYLGSLYYQDHGRAPGAQAIQDAMGLLEWDARKDKRAVFTRVAAHDGAVYLDMGNEAWQAIEIDGEGWRIVNNPPVVFRRPNGLEPLPVPTRPGNVHKLTDFAHIDPEDWGLLAGWVVAALSGSGPFPILVLNGEQGSAKSTLARVVKELIDPSEAELRSQPEDVRDLMIGAGNAWVLAYDNISRISGDVSDALCRISTGGGYAKRKNYTDTEEILINVQRPIVLTGIADFVTRADLMDRAVILSLPAMPEQRRKEERAFWDAFYEARPVLLAGFLNALSEGLRRRDSVQLERLPRMADFAKLAAAAEVALGLEPGEFLSRYAQNRAQGVGGLLEGALIVPALAKLVVVAGSWSGTSSDLLDALELETPEEKRKLRQWPKTARQLSEELKRLAPSLRAARIVDAEQKIIRGARIWQVTRLENCLQDGR